MGLATVQLYNPANKQREFLQFPAAPTSVEVPESGVTTRFSESRTGSVGRRRGREETKYQISATLYGPKRKDLLRFINKEAYVTPADFVAQLNGWHKTDTREGTKLRFFYDDGFEQILADVYIGEYTPKRSGAFGDVALSLTLVEYRKLLVRTDGEAAGDSSSAQVASTTDDPTIWHRNYVVQDGDTLEDIAGSQLGDPDQWELIYNANTLSIAQAQEAAGVVGVDESAPDPHNLIPGTPLWVPGGAGDDDPSYQAGDGSLLTS